MTTGNCDPRKSEGDFGKLFREIKRCKDARRCPDLKSRCYYFEPNPDTISEWMQKEKFYVHEIDRRVMFVCESPGKQFATENLSCTIRCWNGTGGTAQDKVFKKARMDNDFSNCYITNTVKCGFRIGRTKHLEQEIERCLPFLKREINLINPSVIIGVGNNAYHTLRWKVLPHLENPPVLFQITHYSSRGNEKKRWEVEFPELMRLLNRLRSKDIL